MTVSPASGPALKEAVALGVEQVASVGRDFEAVVADPAMDRPGGGQQPVPSRIADLQGLGTLGTFALEVLAQGPNAVETLVQILVHRKKGLLLGHEEYHQPHDHRDRGLVHPSWLHSGEQAAFAVQVGPRDGVDEQLHRSPGLPSELVGYLGL